MIAVWAPRARAAELESGGRALALEPIEGGWWRAGAADLPAGADYAFRIDGKGPFPDPRSPWQPSGVHGPSRALDHAQFAWRDSGWQPPPFASGIIYELHVGTFTQEGTFLSAIARLDHLARLGVTHIELMPVAEFAGSRGWGYDGVDLFAPHHAYGGPEGLKRLVDACHAHGLGVILDVVYNHLGPEGNYLGVYGPYLSDRCRLPWGEMVNFDGPDSSEVRRFFIDNALMWLRDYHVDGLRLDAVHAILDQSPLHFLEQLASEVKDLASRLGRPKVLIAESDLNDPRLVRPQEAGGYGLDALWNEDYHHALHTALTGEKDGYYRDFRGLADVAKALTKGFVYDGIYSAFRRRRQGRSAAGVPGGSFVGFLQNHDQVGGRVAGERLSRLVSPQETKVGAALVFAAPFIPMLFQGEEWGASSPFFYFAEHDDRQVVEAVRRGRKDAAVTLGQDPEAVLDPQAEETFLRSKLDWTEIEREPHAGLLAWHRALIGLRRRLPALSDGRIEDVGVTFDESARWIVVKRGEICLACNLADQGLRVPCPARQGLEVLLASASGVSIDSAEILLPAHSVVFLGPAGTLAA